MHGVLYKITTECEGVCASTCEHIHRRHMHSLLVRDSRRAQKKVEGMIPFILEHVGIQDLNCVGSIRAILEGNLKACTEIPEGMIRYQ